MVPEIPDRASRIVSGAEACAEERALDNTGLMVMSARGESRGGECRVMGVNEEGS